MQRWLLAASVAFSAAAHAQTLTPLHNPPPDGTTGDGYLLTDGRVLLQGGNLNDWWALTPDSSGSYALGTWKKTGLLPTGYAPCAVSGAVLADGRVVLSGGEYNLNCNNFVLTDLGAIFDPVTNTWAKLGAPAGWGYIGDSPATILPNGKFLLGRKLDNRIAELDPKTLLWTELSDRGKHDFNAEESWTLLPDGTVLTADVKATPHTERYSAALQRWFSLGNTPASLGGPPEAPPTAYPGGTYTPPGEIGPAILRPDGTVFATGAVPKGGAFGHTAIYTPGPGGAAGTWKAGPNFPAGDAAGDSFAALLPSGHVLVEGNSGTLYEYNGITLQATPFSAGGGGLLVLPTGEILVDGAKLYRGAGAPLPAWAPTVAAFPATLQPGSTYKITGTQFNGLSQANSFGDEFQTATNYPLVRITNNASHHVIYARTHDHSTMGVATGKAPVFTSFDVPTTIEAGASTLEVVANGIASKPVAVTVQ